MGRRSIATAMALATLACGARTELAVGEPPERRVPRDGGARDAPVIDAPTDARICSAPQRLELVIASVVFALDRSGSMLRPLGDAAVARDAALATALATALPDVDRTSRLGAILYPVAGATPEAGTICDLPPSGLDVPIALGAATDVLATLAAHPAAGGTPTADAIARAHAALEAPSLGRGPRAIVLATDGGPNCNPSGRGMDWYGVAPEACIEADIDVSLCLDTARAVRAIEAARAVGIPTYVVGMDVTLPVLVEALDAMAVAGGHARAGSPRFFGVERADELQAALEEIADEVARCTFGAGAPLEPTGTVWIDGETIPDGAAGWTPGPGGTILIHGAPCDRALSPSAEILFQPTCR